MIGILKWNCWRTTGLLLHPAKWPCTVWSVHILNFSPPPMVLWWPVGPSGKPLRECICSGSLSDRQNEANCVLGSLGNPILSRPHNISLSWTVGVLPGYSLLGDRNRWHFRVKEGSWGRSGLGDRPGPGTLAVFIGTSLSIRVVRMFEYQPRNSWSGPSCHLRHGSRQLTCIKSYNTLSS